MILVPKRKIIDNNAPNSDTTTTIKTTIENTITSREDVRNLGRFNYRLQIPVGTDMYDA